MLNSILDTYGFVAALALVLFSAGRPHGPVLLLLVASVVAVIMIKAVAGRLAAVRGRRGARKPRPVLDLGGMTVNERLACTGLFQEWDAAFLARDRAKLIEIARRIQINDPASTVDTALADPAKYGRR